MPGPAAQPEQEAAMPKATRAAEIVWERPLASGTRTVSSGGRALADVPMAAGVSPAPTRFHQTATN